jgi:hypothetical protein
LTSAIASVLEAPSSGRHSDQPINCDAGQRSGQGRYWLPLSPALIRDADQAARTELDIVCP